MDNPNINPHFNFDVNLAGIRAASGGGMKLPEGFYEGIVSDAFGTTSKNGRPQVALKVAIQGQFEGMIRTAWLGVPQNEDDGVRYYWRGVFESLGYQPAQIDQGIISVKRELLIDRPCTVYYKPGDRDMGIYEELKFLSAHDWAQQKAQFDAATSAPGSAIGATAIGAAAIGGIGNERIGDTLSATTAPDGNGMGNTLTKDGLLNALNR